MNAQDWIDLADVVSGAAIAFAVLYLGHVLGARTKRLEASLSIAEILIEKRIQIYDLASPLLNDVFCYLTYVGQWRSLSPEDVLERKRTLDRLFHSSRPYFSPEVLRRYSAFMDRTFLTERGRGTHGVIRADIERHREEYDGEFDPRWDVFFVSHDAIVRREDVRSAYRRLLEAVGRDLRRNDEREPPGSSSQ